MKIKYYGVPNNARLLHQILQAKQIAVSTSRAQRLASLYRWFFEKPRQCGNVRTASSREKPPEIYDRLSESTFRNDTLLLFKAGLIFPMTREATPQEKASRWLATYCGPFALDFLSNLANQKKLLAELTDRPFWPHLKERNSPR